MLNRCEFIGNLGRDPEVRTMQDGNPVVNLSVGVSEKWTKKDGSKGERTEWIKCVIFNEHLCKVAQNYLKKGSKIFIAGAMQTRKWTDQSGIEKYSTEIVLQKYRGELTMLDGRSDGGGNQGYSENHHGAHGGKQNTPADLDDSIPF